MGGNLSKNSSNNLCNYDCPVCQKTGKVPNIGGRFFLIDDEFCQCNACHTMFEKSRFYKDVSEPPTPTVEGIFIDK
jgi:hypothetical protein